MSYVALELEQSAKFKRVSSEQPRLFLRSQLFATKVEE